MLTDFGQAYSIYKLLHSGYSSCSIFGVRSGYGCLGGLCSWPLGYGHGE